jgi:hypothetical protein
MSSKSLYAILAMVCVVLLLSAPVLMAAGDAKAGKIQSSPDCCKDMKSSEKCCTPSPDCCPGASKASAKADSDTKVRQLKASSSPEVSKAMVNKVKSED